ncbi:hypothetical protein RhiirA4_488115 [Rhizophagus irregularis]|uniref:Uncharacterized protein n=1 Tax=Rhizophagus irregularis TaxID=588596 RepID=A0A2I1HTK2_9GLOM|nr:hypothetical protein RhiirA4_488115 [Rhizophagus irregularis]
MSKQFFSGLSQNYMEILEDDEYYDQYDVTIEVGEDPSEDPNVKWVEQYFELIYRTSLQSNSLLVLQQYCTSFMVKFPEKVSKSLDFTSLPEK